MAWLTGWGYRKEVTLVEQSSGAYTDYPTIITVAWNAHMKNDFADCRFTESDETTLIDYGIVDKTDGVSCTFVIKRDYTSGCTLTVYLYYGNAGAADASVDHGPWALAWYLAYGFGKNPAAFTDGNCSSYPHSASEAIPAWADIIFGGCSANGSYRAYYGRAKINGVAQAWASTALCSGAPSSYQLKWKKYYCSSSMYNDAAFNAGASNTVTFGHFAGSNAGLWVSYYPTDPSVAFGTEEGPRDEADLPAQFEVGQGAEDLAAEFMVLQWAEDLPGEFVVKQWQEDLPAELIVRGTGTDNLPAQFEVIQWLDLSAEFDVGQNAEEVAAEFVVRHSDLRDLLGEFVVRQPASADLLGELIVRQDASADLSAEFEVGQDSADLSGEFIARHTATPLNLAAEFIIRRSAILDLAGEFVVGQAAEDLLGEFVVRHSGPVPWLGGWRYRKTHTLTGSTAGVQTNYQMGVKVYYGAGADGTEVIGGVTFGKVYCNSECKTDFSDVRFTNWDGTTLLDYWLQEKIDSDYAIFWVEVDSIPVSPDTVDIYIYYDNPVATYTDAQQHGKDTFIAFDDFPGVALDGQWTVDANITVTVAGGTLTCKATANSWSTWHGIHMALANVQGIRLESYGANWAHVSNDLFQYGHMLGVSWADIALGHRLSDSHASTGECYLTYLYDSAALAKGDIQGQNPVDLVEQRDQNGAVKFFKDGAEQQAGGETSTDSFDTLMILCNRLTTYQCPNLYLDRILARSFVDPEPAHTAWGPETEVTLFAQFSVRQAASEDLASGFNAHALNEELPAELIVRQAASADLLGEFVVRHPASQDLLGEFIVRQAASQNLLGEFIVRHAAAEDLAAEFIVSGFTPGSVDLHAEFNVLNVGTKDLLAEFGVRRSTTASLLAEFGVRRSTTASLPAEFGVRHSATWNLAAEFSIRRSSSLDLPAELIVRQVASQNLLGEFVVRHPDSANLLGEFAVRRSGSSDLLGELVVRQAASQDLLGELIVRHPGSVELLAEFAIRRSSNQNLLAEFIVRHPDSAELLGKFVVRQAASQELGASFEIRLPLETLFCKFYVRPTGSSATDFTIIDLRRVLTVVDTDREMTVTPRRRMKVK